MSINPADRQRPPQSALLARADLVFLMSDLVRSPAAMQAGRWRHTMQVLDALLRAGWAAEQRITATRH